VQWLSHAAVRLRRKSGVADFTPHDLRRTAATLNHTPAKIARTYNRSTYDAEKRQALAILGELIESIASDGEARSNVVRLA